MGSWVDRSRRSVWTLVVSCIVIAGGVLYLAREQPAHASTALEAPLELAAQLVQSLRTTRAPELAASPAKVHTAPSARSLPSWRDDDNPLSGTLGRNDAERKIFFDAEQAAIEDCMKERGFPYERAKYEEEAKPELEPHLDYGLAKQLGEKHDEPEAAPPSLEEQQRHDALLGKADGPDDEHVAGVEAGGYTLSWDTSSCVSEARRRVYGDERSYRQLAFVIEDLKFEAHDLAEADDGFTRAVEGWKSCMKRAHLPFDSRDQLVGSLAARHERGELDGEQLAREERDVAAVDERCDAENEVGATMKVAFARTQKEVAERNADRLDAFAQLRETSLVRASEFLDE